MIVEVIKTVAIKSLLSWQRSRIQSFLKWEKIETHLIKRHEIIILQSNTERNLKFYLKFVSVNLTNIRFLFIFENASFLSHI